MPLDKNTIKGCFKALLAITPKDWVANECLANSAAYAKPDAEKTFILWEAQGTSIQITGVDSVKTNHPWLYQLFIIDDSTGNPKVRFPYNSWDTVLGESICPHNISNDNKIKYIPSLHQEFRVIRRWSSASRSCFALIPKNVPSLTQVHKWDYLRNPSVGTFGVSQEEWKQDVRTNCRFYSIVGGNLGSFCSSQGQTANGDNCNSRLYSVKTGVSYVGSKYETGFGKNLLEENSTLAIMRSNVIHKVESSRQQRDDRYRVQIELLTITAECTVDEKKVRDGFQVRDLSCMKTGEAYIPGHAIPYNGKAFSNKQGKEDCQFWIENFAFPCGQAKARMFLDYGLIHMSANAQNFIVGFKNSNYVAFILRDIGDTSWHDEYVKNILGTSHPAFAHGYNKEKSLTSYHLLSISSNTDYPPPHLIRAAAHSVISHGFAKATKDNSIWKDQDVLEFAQAILSGFRDYFIKVLGFPGQYPDTPDVHHDVMLLGKKFGYPGNKDLTKCYQKKDVEIYLGNHPDDSLAIAAYTRQISAELLKRSGDKDKAIEALINAEEFALCAAIELHIRSLIAQKKSKPSIRPFTFSGSQSEGLLCSRCSCKHGSMPSSVFGRWHVCMTCNRYYCGSCGKKLSWAGLLTRTRICQCGGNTTLID